MITETLIVSTSLKNLQTILDILPPTTTLIIACTSCRCMYRTLIHWLPWRNHYIQSWMETSFSVITKKLWQWLFAGIRSKLIKKQQKFYSLPKRYNLIESFRYIVSRTFAAFWCCYLLPTLATYWGLNSPAYHQSEAHQDRSKTQGPPSRMPNVSYDELLRSRPSASQKLLMRSKSH